jgi:hypothetical protein
MGTIVVSAALPCQFPGDALVTRQSTAYKTAEGVQTDPLPKWAVACAGLTGLWARGQCPKTLSQLR